jgi:peptidoglycan/xylan/chitin deacetylase (PgdA/CDA1 family)
VCKNDKQIALTFDDGPFNFTMHLLDVLASYGAKATFFVTGNNMGKGQIDIEETGYQPCCDGCMRTATRSLLTRGLIRTLLR